MHIAGGLVQGPGFKIGVPAVSSGSRKGALDTPVSEIDTLFPRLLSNDDEVDALGHTGHAVQCLQQMNSPSPSNTSSLLNSLGKSVSMSERVCLCQKECVYVRKSAGW